jgi:glutamate formiminotransferase/formiminotetrahydrofolate cyclodeaminase
MQCSETQVTALPALMECVPNFSEGRDMAKIEAIIQAILDGPDVLLLHHTRDVDHNRSVITFVGAERSVGDAAVRGIGRAAELIDLRRHQGVHPRIGAADVVPFVPLSGSRMEDCVCIASRVAEETASRFKIPAYLYEAAARRNGRRYLEMVRRGQFEELREKIKTDPDRLPDFGEPELHPAAGAVAVGARDLLVAFNINLTTPDVSIARSVARAIRASNGGLPCVKALGLYLPSRNLAQVSINLTDFRTTPLAAVFEAVRKEANRLEAEILESEIVGLIPAAAIAESDAAELQIRNFDEDLILENRLARVLGAQKSR